MENIQISIAAARVNANMTQGEAAEKLHITKQTLVNWEAGRTEPTVSQFRAISELYGIPISFLFLPAKSV